MKTKSKCIGCQSIKLVNALGLCKRCNRHAHDFISNEEMERIKREREILLASKGTRKAKKVETPGEEEKAEGEDEGEGEESSGAEKTG
jgi:hypothetical protein